MSIKCLWRTDTKFKLPPKSPKASGFLFAPACNKAGRDVGAKDGTLI